MRDYLSNLVTKSFDLAEVIQPRPVSLFEPLPAAGGSAFGSSAALEPVDDERPSGITAFEIPSSVQGPAGQPLVSYPPALDLEPPPDHPGSNLAQPASSRVSRPALSLSGSPSLDQPPVTPATVASSDETGTVPPKRAPRSGQRQPERSPSQPASDAARPASSQTTRPVLGQKPARPFVGRTSPEPSGSVQQPLTPPASRNEGDVTLSTGIAARENRPVIQPPIQPLVIKRLVSPAEPPPTTVPPWRGSVEQADQFRPQPASQRLAIERVVPPAESRLATSPPPELSSSQPEGSSRPTAIVAQPKVTPYVEPAAPVTAEPATPEPPSTIQVTIGRIEVRATPPSALPPKQQQSKPPVMSLDEYLRQRANGGA